MNAQDIVDSFLDKAGWDDHSIIDLLCRFINERANPVDLQDFLKRQYDFEIAESGENDEFENSGDDS